MAESRVVRRLAALVLSAAGGSSSQPPPPHAATSEAKNDTEPLIAASSGDVAVACAVTIAAAICGCPRRRRKVIGPSTVGRGADPCSVIYMWSPMRVPMPTTAPKINGMQMMSMKMPVLIILIIGTYPDP